MHQSPRTRRLHNDLTALERLRSESSVFRFTAVGDPPQQYQLWFQGKSLWRDRAKVKPLESHRVEIKLGASYPRTVPELRWLTPIFHPNISEIGMVCLGGYGTHWVPSVQLDDLCVMLWDMARYHNYDIRSPYNREAALWVASQTTFRFPLDDRPLRDLRAALGRSAVNGEQPPDADSNHRGKKKPLDSPPRRAPINGTTPVTRVLNFIERYSRVFGNVIGTEASQGAGTGDVRRRPEFQHMRQILDRSAASPPPRVRAPQPETADSNPQPAISSQMADEQAIELADTNHTERAPERDELVILDENENNRPPDRVAGDGGGILYIE
ncbi:MAG TPA: ubiquitin-conjugating enzyme E2 [Isosphaeraceae bacterium]|nr:ubiquitin-conjugating enzyme E2 [Isosphaeraceae bacterium]